MKTIMRMIGIKDDLNQSKTFGIILGGPPNVKIQKETAQIYGHKTMLSFEILQVIRYHWVQNNISCCMVHIC